MKLRSSRISREEDKNAQDHSPRCDSHLEADHGRAVVLDEATEVEQTLDRRLESDTLESLLDD